MSNTINHSHYNLEDQTQEIQDLAKAGKLTGPMFIGQGCTQSVGSDCYGAYITAKKQIGKKTIFGLVQADVVMHGHWSEGDQDCSMPEGRRALPSQWITKYGKNWYYCDTNGKRFPGDKCKYRFNGAYAYRDPSF